MKKLTSIQLAEIKEKNFIPDAYLDAYLQGKDWAYVSNDGTVVKVPQ